MTAESAANDVRTVMTRLEVDSAEALQTLPFETVLDAVTSTGRTDVGLRPVVDGRVLPGDMFVGRSAPSARGR